MNALTKHLRDELKSAAADKDYREMQTRIIPNVPVDRIIGVRVPDIRKIAAKYKKTELSPFFDDIPHKYHEENYLHALFLNGIKDYDECMERVETFLPYVDNWAVCDGLAPKCFAKHPDELTEKIRQWHKSTHTYTVRFATGCLMRWFLDERFSTEYADMAAAVRSDEYYINMMTAWYFATALAKQYDAVIPYIEQHRLDKWTHNKAIQKAIESFRVTDDHKDYLRTLKL